MEDNLSKLYFKYGTMGSSKTANALMCKFNYEQQGFNVLLLKPGVDDRDIEEDEIIVRSRIGLKSKCFAISRNINLIDFFKEKCNEKRYEAIIIDESQFLTTEQVDQLKTLSLEHTVICYGLLTDFKIELFEGSKRLIELADNLQEIKSMCSCGRKSNVNARFVDGNLVTSGDVLAIEKGNVTYEPMCYHCYLKRKENI